MHFEGKNSVLKESHFLPVNFAIPSFFILLTDNMLKGARGPRRYVLALVEFVIKFFSLPGLVLMISTVSKVCNFKAYCRLYERHKS